VSALLILPALVLFFCHQKDDMDKQIDNLDMMSQIQSGLPKSFESLLAWDKASKFERRFKTFRHACSSESDFTSGESNFF
jgi:hypothetical protein